MVVCSRASPQAPPSFNSLTEAIDPGITHSSCVLFQKPVCFCPSSLTTDQQRTNSINEAGVMSGGLVHHVITRVGDAPCGSLQRDWLMSFAWSGNSLKILEVRVAFTQAPDQFASRVSDAQSFCCYGYRCPCTRSDWRVFIFVLIFDPGLFSVAVCLNPLSSVLEPSQRPPSPLTRLHSSCVAVSVLTAMRPSPL